MSKKVKINTFKIANGLYGNDHRVALLFVIEPIVKLCFKILGTEKVNFRTIEDLNYKLEEAGDVTSVQVTFATQINDCTPRI